MASSGTGTALVISLPGWLDEVVATFPTTLVDDDACMELVVALSRENVARGGGPFGAAVFAGRRLVAAGVNRVLDTGFSIAHAEIVALMHAQQVIATSASAITPPATRWQSPYALFASTEPCCQCFGALVWAGVQRLVCGATTADAEAAGFDEGPKPPGWEEILRARGIEVTQGLRRADASDVLQDYVRRGGPIYGMRHPTIT